MPSPIIRQKSIVRFPHQTLCRQSGPSHFFCGFLGRWSSLLLKKTLLFLLRCIVSPEKICQELVHPMFLVIIFCWALTGLYNVLQLSPQQSRARNTSELLCSTIYRYLLIIFHLSFFTSIIHPIPRLVNELTPFCLFVSGFTFRKHVHLLYGRSAPLLHPCINTLWSLQVFCLFDYDSVSWHLYSHFRLCRIYFHSAKNIS